MRCLQSADGHFANWNREDVGSVNHSLGTSVIHMPPGGKVGRFLPGCVQQSSSQPPSPSSDFLTLVGGAASSYLWSAIERIAIMRLGASGSRAGGECKNKERKKSGSCSVQQGRFLSHRRKSHSYVEARLQKSHAAQREICCWIAR